MTFTVLIDTEETAPMTKLRCICGKDFWVDPCTEENTYWTGEKLIPECPECGYKDQ